MRKTHHYAISLASERPAFSRFAVDALGQGKLAQNPVLDDPSISPVPGLKLEGQSIYMLAGQPVWRVSGDDQSITLRSDFASGVAMPPFTLAFNQKANHATLLGLMRPGELKVALPCVLHLPDMGSVRITCNVPGAKLDYDARRFVKPTPFVRIAFPPATAQKPQIDYWLEVVAIHPQLPGIDGNPLYDGFRRDFLNIFQVNPRLQMLANNASSDACTFTLFEYSSVARHAPPLAEGLTCLDLVRMTLDRYLSGVKGYGQVGYACEPTDGDLVPWKTPWTSLDSLPSLLIGACDYVEGTSDLPWARANYAKLAALMREMMAGDKDGDGLLEYPGTGNFGDRPQADLRPSNWWDTINFGHKDAFANALAYRAGKMFSELARQLGHEADANSYAASAARLRAAYASAFLNPATGVLAGWKSADGQLHDYWFTFVQGVAITYGLLDDKTANSVMDCLLAKMQKVGYDNSWRAAAGRWQRRFSILRERRRDRLLGLLHGQGALPIGPGRGGATHFPSDAERLCARRIPGLRRKRHVARLARLAGRRPRLRRPARGQLSGIAGGVR